jgi:glycosyltransferase involved in cell wall biosynthesis
VHGRDEADIPGWRLDKRLYRLLDQLCGRWLQRRVVAVSAQLAKELAAGFPEEQVTVIENGVDIAGVLLAAARDAELPGRPGRMRVGFVSRLVSVKRIDLFLQTAHKLHRRNPGMFDFYIVGDGPQYDLCRRLIAQLGLVDCTHMLGFRPDVAAVLAGMDLLLITSDHEGLPMTLLEAMSLEVPVVASAVGGIPRALGHGQCGRLVHAQQAKAYVAAVLELLADPVSRRQQIRHALDRVRDYYSAERSAAGYANLYRQLCPDKAAAYRGGEAASPARTMRG